MTPSNFIYYVKNVKDIFIKNNINYNNDLARALIESDVYETVDYANFYYKLLNFFKIKDLTDINGVTKDTIANLLQNAIIDYEKILT